MKILHCDVYREIQIPILLIFHFLKEIVKCNTIGLTSGASAPEKLVQDFILEIKKNMNVSIEEVVTASEKVVFKLPKELN